MSKYRIGTFYGKEGAKLVVTEKTTKAEVDKFAENADESLIKAINSPKRLTKRVRDRIARQEEAAEKSKKK